MRCQFNDEQWMLYLADALRPAEQQGMDRHLEQACPRCQAGLAEARRWLDELPLAIEPVEPAGAVRQRLLDQVTLADEADETVAAPAPLATIGPEREAAAQNGRGSWRAWRWVAACAAAAALAAGVTFAGVSQRLDEQQARIDELNLQLARTDEQLGDYSDRNGHLQQLVEVGTELLVTLQSSTVEMISLKGVDDLEDTSARLLWDRSRNVGHFFGPDNLHPSDGRRFRLWLVGEDEQAVSAATFSPDEFGRAQFEIGLPEDYAHPVDWAHISHDDVDVADRPLLRGDLSG